MFESHKQIIDAWPSLEDFSEDAGVPCNTAKQMRSRNKIHSDYWCRIVAGAERRGIEGVTHKALAETQRPRRVVSPQNDEPSAEASRAA